MEYGFNPYLPSYEYVPDGEPHVFGDRIYIYGSHDKAGSETFCENDYVCYSAPTDNLKDWRYEGVIYRKSQDPNKRKKIFNQMWAPDVCQGVDGRFYLYYCFAWANYIGVAVSNKPQGPYEYYGQVKRADGSVFGASKKERQPFDPAVLCENGKVYVYTDYSTVSRNMQKLMKNLLGVKLDMLGGRVLSLESDMLTIKEEKPLLPGIENSKGTGFEGHEFYEASSIRHIGDKYYFVYSSALSHELCYAISDRPDGGFVYGGTIVSNGDVGYQGRSETEAINYWGNNHGGIATIGDDHYIFYHRQTSQTEASRQGCAERITIDAEGKIAQVPITSCGLNGGPLPAKGSYASYIACILRSKDGACKTTKCGKKGKNKHPFITQDQPDGVDGQQYITNLFDGACFGFRYFDMDHPKLSVVAKGADGTLSVYVDEINHKLGKINLSLSPNWTKSQSVDIHVQGVHELIFVYEGTGMLSVKDIIFE